MTRTDNNPHARRQALRAVMPVVLPDSTFGAEKGTGYPFAFAALQVGRHSIVPNYTLDPAISTSQFWICRN